MNSLQSIPLEALVHRCADFRDRAVWDEFVARTKKPIAISVLRVGRIRGQTAPQLVEELIQDTYARLCADDMCSLREFASRHADAILGYVKTVAANVARDHFKAEETMKRDPGQRPTSLTDFEPPNPNDGPKAMDRRILLDQIDCYLKEGLAGPDQDRDRRIFWLHYSLGFSAKDIAALPAVGMTTKGVESALFRITQIVRSKAVKGGAQQKSAESRHFEKGF